MRLHTDSAAASLAFRLRAHAFTIGPHIFFAAGRFQPQTYLDWRCWRMSLPMSVSSPEQRHGHGGD